MKFHLLGQLAALDDGQSVDVPSGKTRELLALLLLSPGEPVPHREIVRFLWPGEDTKPSNIRQYCLRLRRAVGLEVGNSGGATHIQVDPASVDLVRFRSQYATALRTGNPQKRRGALLTSLAEWRGGAPLEDLPGEAFAQRRSWILRELHDAFADCVRTDLECSEPHIALQRADDALVHWPDSETLLGLKVQSLGALGRHYAIDPLLAQWKLRFNRPTAHLLLARTSQENILTSGIKPPDLGVLERLNQLPAQQKQLIGRRSELKLLADVVLGREPGSGPIAVVAGLAGVGKTFLAVAAAQHLAPNFPDGVLYIDLRGFSTLEPEEVASVLVRFLNDLRTTPATVNVDGLVSAYRSALSDRRVLVVLDNARDEAQVRPLLPGQGRSAAIVTSRRRLEGLVVKEGAKPIDLAPLDRHEAGELLKASLGEERMGLARPFAGSLLDYCSGLPIALRIVSAQIGRRQPQDLPGVVRRLLEERSGLRPLDLRTDELNVSSLLESSYRLLPTPAAKLLWQLSVHPGPTISWRAIQALGHDHATVGRSLDDLIDMSLVTEPTLDRYAMHDLVRIYATQLADQQAPGDYDESLRRVLEFLLQNAWSCDLVLDPDRRLPITANGEFPVVSPRDHAAATAWFDAEYATLSAALQLAGRIRLDRYTWLLALTLLTYQWRSHRYLDALGHLTNALPAAERIAGPEDVAMIRRLLAGTHRGLGDRARAMAELRGAVRTSQDHGDLKGTALGRYSLGIMLHEDGVTDPAVAELRAALAGFKTQDDRLGQGAALDGLANVHHQAGDHFSALEYCRRSLALLEGTADLNGQAHGSFTMGRIRAAIGEHDAAVTAYGHALTLYRSMAYPSREARTLVRLSDSLSALGRDQDAEQVVEEARLLLARLGEKNLDAAVERQRQLS
ncbi:AfsR/SARP family transcriptional regulator [Peterkaempfera bronchialis]|uniref:AfsR/SARP family transcriptional regulator n=1 Tax=Peterkaempfera bronchialis TaxID=2126346 RepID=UPI003C2CBC6A